jgi:phage repressor protein C with HTH and peptisase S24 domain
MQAINDKISDIADIANRISRLMAAKGLNPARLAALAGLSRVAIYDIVPSANKGAEGQKRSKNPSYMTLAKISAAFPDVNPGWLLTGVGSMLLEGSNSSLNGSQIGLKSKKDDQHNTHLNTHLNTHPIPKTIPESGQNHPDHPSMAHEPVIPYTGVQSGSKLQRAKAAMRQAVTASGIGQATFLPHALASAGSGAFIDTSSNQDAQIVTIPGISNQGTQIIIRSEGDSMAPTIYNGDLLVLRLVSDLKNLKEDAVCVVLTHETGYIKRVRNRITERNCLVLKSDNPTFTTFQLPIDQVVQVWFVLMRLSAQFPTELRNYHARLNKVEEWIAAVSAKNPSLLEDGFTNHA